MRDTGNKELRKLARDYYNGDLSYESYRSVRTQLLDRITTATGDDDCTRSAARQANTRGRAGGQSLEHYSERSWYLRGAIWMLIVVLIAIILMAWIILPLGQPDPAGTAASGADAQRVEINSREEYRHLNG
jgi:hypothetical protein